jgi:hypothetical protein
MFKINNKLKRKEFYLIGLIIFASCGLKTYNLNDGIYKAAKNPRVYKNKLQFNSSILNFLDTMAIYEEIYTISYVDKSPFNPRKKEYLSTTYPESFKGVYRFYSNGCYNLFIIKNGETNFTNQMFDSKWTGWRGVYYLDKQNRIIGDLITQISGGGEIGISKDVLEFRKDTLFVTPFKANTKNVYLRKTMSFEILNSKAEW